MPFRHYAAFEDNIAVLVDDRKKDQLHTILHYEKCPSVYLLECTIKLEKYPPVCSTSYFVLARVLHAREKKHSLHYEKMPTCPSAVGNYPPWLACYTL